MSIFIVTRFCILSEKSFLGTKKHDSLASYAEKLLSKNKLISRLEIMEKVTVQSICNQKDFDCPAYWVVLIPDILPIWAYNQIREMGDRVFKSSGVKFEAVAVKSGLEVGDGFYLDDASVDLKAAVGKAIFSHVAEGDLYVTARVDDDDALASNFLKFLYGYLSPSFVGLPVTFPLGYEAVFKNGGLSDIKRVYFPKVSAGLSLVCRRLGEKETAGGHDIYSKGDHTKVDLLSPVISDARESMFIRVLHDNNDSSGGKNVHSYLNSPDLNDPGLKKFPDLPLNFNELKSSPGYSFVKERRGMNFLRETKQYAELKKKLQLGK